MINYTEKGVWLHEEVSRQGYIISQHGSVWVTSNDVAVQAIIDAFNPLPYAKADAKALLKAEAATRASDIYSFLGDNVETAVDFYTFASDIYLSILPAARGTLQPNLVAFKNIHDAAVDAIAVINAMTDWQLVMAYDVVNTPSWP